MTPKNVAYPSLLTRADCDVITTEILEREQTEQSGESYWTQKQHIVKNSYGVYNLPTACVHASRLTAVCAQDYGALRFVNNYTRIYRHGAFLQLHADRPDCDVTLSVCVHSNVSPGWPLVISNVYHSPPWDIDHHPPQEYFARDTVAYIMAPGTGVACLGSRFPHWRAPLQGDASSVVIQAFYHLSFA